MASISQRALNLAYAGCAPQDIAQFLGQSETTVLGYLADLTVDGASQEQRILSFVRAGHHADEIAVWMGVSVSTVFSAIADTATDPSAAWLPPSVVSGSPTIVSAAGTTLVSGGRFLLDATSAPFIQPLPTSPIAGNVLTLESVTWAAKAVTLQAQGTAQIDGTSSLRLGPKASGAVYRMVTLQFDGSNWRIIDATRNSWLHVQDHIANVPPMPLIGQPVDLSGSATFYVDSAAGSDANAGTYAAPWKTLAKAFTTNTPVAGQTYALKCGSVFREALPVNASGSAGSQITVGQYGSGPRPKIKGSTDYSTLSWSVYSGSIYQASVTLTAGGTVYVDELTPLSKVSTLVSLTAAGQWFYDSTGHVLYVWMQDGSTPAGHQIEMPGTVSTLCNGGAHPNWTIQDIGVMHGGTGISGIYVNASQAGWEVKRCQIGPTPGAGLAGYGAGYSFHDNYVVSCWDGIEYPNSATAAPGIVANGTASARINNNRVTGCYYGIRPTAASLSVTIDHNVVYLNHVNGIDNNGGTGTINVYNNTVHHRPTGAAGHGIDQQAGGTGFTGKNNLVYTDYSGGSPGQNIEALTIEGNTSTNDDYALVYITPGATNVYPGKFGTSGGDVNNTGIYSTWAGYIAAVQGSIAGGYAHAIFGKDPLFVDPANGDYRLQPGSPAIAAGVALTGFTNADAVNIGAH